MAKQVTEEGHKSMRMFALALLLMGVSFLIYKFASDTRVLECPSKLEDCRHSVDACDERVEMAVTKCRGEATPRLAACAFVKETEEARRDALEASLRKRYEAQIQEVRQACNSKVKAAVHAEQLRLVQCFQSPTETKGSHVQTDPTTN